MTLPIGKIALDAKAANSLWFSQDGQRLWIHPLWGALLTVTDEGARPLAREPSRAVALRSDRRDRVVLSWWRTEGGDGSETDLHGIVPYDLASGELGPELEVSRRLQSAPGSFVHRMALGPGAERLAVLFGGSTADATLPCILEIWDIASASRLARHEVPGWHADVHAIAFSADAQNVLTVVSGVLGRWPVDGAAPASRALAQGAGGPFTAFCSLGGADRLPVSREGNILLHDAGCGALGLFTEAGDEVWQHRSEQSYFTKEARRSVASMSPSGRHIVAAIGAGDALAGAAAIEVFAGDGSSVRRIEWKCAKGEYASDVDITDEGWIALATNKRAEIFSPGGAAAKKRR